MKYGRPILVILTAGAIGILVLGTGAIPMCAPQSGNDVTLSK